MNLIHIVSGKIISITASIIVFIALHFPPLMNYLIKPVSFKIPTTNIVINNEYNKPIVVNKKSNKPAVPVCPEGTYFITYDVGYSDCILLSTMTPYDLKTDPLTVLPKGEVYGKNLILGANTSNNVTFNVLSLYEIKPTTLPKTSNEYSEQTWSRFNDFYFKISEWSIDIIKKYSHLYEINRRGYWSKSQGGIFDIRTFSFNNRTYFIFGGTDCGNGGCGDSNMLFSIDDNGSYNDPVEIFEHGWSWGHGGQPVTGFQGDEKLDFVASFKGNLFLFSNGDSPIVELDKNGNLIKKISDKNINIENILMGL